MTQEQLKKWILHFQNRIILLNDPIQLYFSLIKVLYRKYDNENCSIDICPIINYLDCNLPKLEFSYTKGNSNLNNEFLLLEGCKSFLDIKVFIKIGEGSFYGYTFLNNIDFFVIKNGNVYFNVKKHLNSFSSVLPNNVYLNYSIKYNTTSEYEQILETTNIGYYTNAF